jgi:hypothetical protein
MSSKQPKPDRPKQNGSMFGLPAFQMEMRSCLLCGKHRRPNELQSRRLLGRAQWVCSPSCKKTGAPHIETG